MSTLGGLLFIAGALFVLFLAVTYFGVVL